MRVKKYVLDANIWISYFISKHQSTLTDIVLENYLVIYYCDELLTEVKRVLTYDHLKRFNININESIAFIKSTGINYTLTYPIKTYIIGDLDDNYIIALALQTNSGFVTSGDRHILDQKNILEEKYTKLKIITKAQFEQRFK